MIQYVYVEFSIAKPSILVELVVLIELLLVVFFQRLFITIHSLPRKTHKKQHTSHSIRPGQQAHPFLRPGVSQEYTSRVPLLRIGQRSPQETVDPQAYR